MSVLVFAPVGIGRCPTSSENVFTQMNITPEEVMLVTDSPANICCLRSNIIPSVLLSSYRERTNWKAFYCFLLCRRLGPDVRIQRRPANFPELSWGEHNRRKLSRNQEEHSCCVTNVCSLYFLILITYTFPGLTQAGSANFVVRLEFYGLDIHQDNQITLAIIISISTVSLLST